MIFEFIEAKKAEYGVVTMCRVFGVSASGFYAWLKRPASKRAGEDRALVVQIKAFHKQSGKTYGSPRIHEDFKGEGIKVGKNRIAKLMRKEGIKGVKPRKYKSTTDSSHSLPVAELSLIHI